MHLLMLLHAVDFRCAKRAISSYATIALEVSELLERLKWPVQRTWSFKQLATSSHIHISSARVLC
jgi:hypothetical protein